MRISFHGACREVSGSCFLIETAGKKILFDCGLFQGSKLAEERNFAPFSFDPKSLDAVVICHAHLDHTGRLPKLVKDGFAGKIFGTVPTKELAKLVLDDNEKLMREEAQREKTPILYTKNDINRTMQLFITILYNEKLEIAPGVSLTLKNAGHILGSAIAVFEAEGKKVVYTSDLGNTPSLLLDPAEFIDSADYVISESTYGGRSHEDIRRRQEKLAQVINETIRENGVLLIPAFAIERTQELLHDIEHLSILGNCEAPAFFLDSPLAAKVTAVFEKYPEYLSERLREFHKNLDFFRFERLRITSSVEESKSIAEQPNPKVIIAGSGMMNGGRILHHAQKYLENEKNALLFVSYQAAGSLGRRLFEGDRQVKIFGHKIQVRAKVESIRSYSSHADLPQLINWLSKIKGVKNIFIVHGEVEQALVFSGEIKRQLNIETIIPQQEEEHML